MLGLQKFSAALVVAGATLFMGGAEAMEVAPGVAPGSPAGSAAAPGVAPAVAPGVAPVAAPVAAAPAVAAAPPVVVPTGVVVVGDQQDLLRALYANRKNVAMPALPQDWHNALPMPMNFVWTQIRLLDGTWQVVAMDKDGAEAYKRAYDWYYGWNAWRIISVVFLSIILALLLFWVIMVCCKKPAKKQEEVAPSHRYANHRHQSVDSFVTDDEDPLLKRQTGQPVPQPHTTQHVEHV